MGRNGWLVAMAATGAYAVGTGLVRRLDRAAVVVTGVFVAIFVLVTRAIGFRTTKRSSTATPR